MKKKEIKSTQKKKNNMNEISPTLNKNKDTE
jgi:hypothetical protein